MVSPFADALTRARTIRRPRTQTVENPVTIPAPAPADRIHRRPEGPTPNPGRGLRCLWYDDALADTLTAADEFLRTPAAIAALAEFYRSRRDCCAPESEARALIDALGSAAAWLCG